MRKYLLLLSFVFLFGCVANRQTVDLPDNTKITVTTPKDQKSAAEVKIFYKTISNDVVEVTVDTTTGTQFDTTFTNASIKNFKVYHYAGIALVFFGIFMIVIKKPPEVYTGIGMIIGGIGVGILGAILPVIGKYAIPIVAVLIIAGLAYVFIYRKKFGNVPAT